MGRHCPFELSWGSHRLEIEESRVMVRIGHCPIDESGHRQRSASSGYRKRDYLSDQVMIQIVLYRGKC